MPLKEAAYDEPLTLVRALVNARILLSSGSEQNATIRLAHQRVLENWKRASEIVATNAEFYRIRDDVEALERRWEKSDKKRDLLIPKGVPLAEAERSPSATRASFRRRRSASLPPRASALGSGSGWSAPLPWYSPSSRSERPWRAFAPGRQSSAPSAIST